MYNQHSEQGKVGLLLRRSSHAIRNPSAPLFHHNLICNLIRSSISSWHNLLKLNVGYYLLGMPECGCQAELVRTCLYKLDK